MHDQPKRTSSEPTLVLDRAMISEAAKKAIAEAIDSYQEGTSERETLVRCPGCVACACCKGAGMVTFGRAEVWEATAASLTELDNPVEVK
jgi:hypothetical protein